MWESVTIASLSYRIMLVVNSLIFSICYHLIFRLYVQGRYSFLATFAHTNRAYLLLSPFFTAYLVISRIKILSIFSGSWVSR
jgi:hypothetical protein